MYFVDYFVSFGEVAHETFSSRLSMRLFMRNLPASAILAWGPIQTLRLPEAA